MHEAKFEDANEIKAIEPVIQRQSDVIRLDSLEQAELIKKLSSNCIQSTAIQAPKYPMNRNTHMDTELSTKIVSTKRREPDTKGASTDIIKEPNTQKRALSQKRASQKFSQLLGSYSQPVTPSQRHSQGKTDVWLEKREEKRVRKGQRAPTKKTSLPKWSCHTASQKTARQ